MKINAESFQNMHEVPALLANRFYTERELLRPVQTSDSAAASVNEDQGGEVTGATRRAYLVVAFRPWASQAPPSWATVDNSHHQGR